MIKRTFLAITALFLGAALTLVNPSPAKAAFNQNNIMSDSVFNNSGSMNSGQIDAFLNSFPSSCISTNRGFVSSDVVGYNPTNGYLYGGGVSAGTVIANASQAYDLNPQVLLATLQKEQSLVSGTAGCHYETPPTQNPCPDPPYGTSSSCVTACQHAGGCVYIAMGYDCPYYCVPNSTGFSKQVIKAAWKLKFVQQRSLGNFNWNVQKPGWDNSDDPATSYDGYMTQGNLKRNSSSQTVYYDGFRPVNSGSLSVHLDSGATAALYSYTPFTNGNSSFVNIFEGWFGSTINNASQNILSFVRLNHGSGNVEVIDLPSVANYSYMSGIHFSGYPAVAADGNVVPIYWPNGDLVLTRLNHGSGNVEIVSYGKGSNYNGAVNYSLTGYPAVAGDGNVVPLFKPNGDLSFIRLNHGSGNVEVVTYSAASNYKHVNGYSLTGYPAVAGDGNVVPMFWPNGDLVFIRLNHVSGNVELISYSASSNYKGAVNYTLTGYPAVAGDGAVVPLFKPSGELSFLRLNHGSGNVELVSYSVGSNYTQLSEAITTDYPAITPDGAVIPLFKR
jgi:hypothetical protein